MRIRGTVQSAVLAGSIVIGLAALSAAAGASVAARTSPSSRVANKVSLTLSADVVKPRVGVVIEATVAPRERGRAVLLRLSTGHRFRNLGFATTNGQGIARFHHAFGAIGSIKLRAEIIATGDEPQVISDVVGAQVVPVLPFVLPPGSVLQMGARGALVLELQRRLSALGYWLGTPDGVFADATQQAVYAMEKAAGIGRVGVVNPQFAVALNNDVVPVPRTKTGDAIDVDLERDLVMIVQNGQLKYTLNTSTGGGYTYTQDGATNVATTPRGAFNTNRTVDGTVVDTLGTLWRPRFFDAGYAIHGDSYVPPTPVSHGCVRISNEAIDWIWASNIDPVGEAVFVY